MEKKYVVVTALAQYRMRYAIPMDELQKLNPAAPVDPAWALDSVTCNDVKEFSQLWLGETIVDHEVVSEQKILEKFDSDNDYQAGWSTEKKLEYINNWREDHK
jgi:hypothetical protein